MSFRPCAASALVLACAAALALAGCALQAGASPEASLPALAAGGGLIASDQGAAVPETSAAPSSQEPGEASGEENPAASSQTSAAAPAGSSPSSSSAAPASSAKSSSSSSTSSSREEPEEKEEEPDEEEEPEEPEEEAPPPPRPSAPGSSGKPSSSSAPEPEPDPEPEDEEEEPDEPEEPDESASSWQNLRVNMNGSAVSGEAVSIVAQIVQNEVGSSYPAEAIKAQAVAAYTFVRYHNATGSAPSVGGRTPSANVTKLVKEVAGEQITYGGKPILASYGAMSAGWTSSSKSVWGTALPYLTPVESEGDQYETKFEVTTAMSAAKVMQKLESSLDVSLDDKDKDNWFEILSHCDDTGLYVDKVRVGGPDGVVTTGRKLRENILGLRSTAFEIRYDPGADSFEFTTRGYGHGVGMSQVGAKYYAQQGWDHVEILEHYYSGAVVE